MIVATFFIFSSFAFAATVTYPNTTQVKQGSIWQNYFGGPGYYAKNITFTSSSDSLKIEIETGFKLLNDLPSGDFGFNIPSDSAGFNYGVAFTDHNGFVQGGIYLVSAWKDPIENGSPVENYGSPSDSHITPAQIKQGTLIGQTNVIRTDLANGDSLFSFDINLPAIVNASSFGYIWTTAICGNGVINGVAVIPPPSPPASTGEITVVKHVVNDNGRTKVVADFPLFVNGASVVSGMANSFSVGAYVVTETPDSNYTRTFSGDCDASGSIILASGDNKTCTITNDDIAPPPPPLPPPPPSCANCGGSPLTVPPLIKVIKTPNPLSLPNGPGLVTYTYTVRNIGTVPMTAVTMADDSCSPVALLSGDTNTDSKLDVIETWNYSCAATLSQTHTNIIVAKGWAGGLSATDQASATVSVAPIGRVLGAQISIPAETPPVIPKFPKTGFSPFPENSSLNIILLFGDMAVVLAAFVVIFKKRAF